MSGHTIHTLQREAVFDGFLVDLDGTLIDSTEAVIKHWGDVGKKINVDPKVVLQASHGRRSLDVLQVVAPEFATWDFVGSIEDAIPVNHGHLAKSIPGARDLLSALAAHSVPWALVTSSTLPLVQGWRKLLDLPLPTAPELLVTAESVPNGKPDPGAYLLGRQKLGLDAIVSSVLVIEDSPAGIEAGKAAGCKVIGLLTSHTYEQIAGSAPDWILQDLQSLKVRRNADGKIVVEMLLARQEA